MNSNVITAESCNIKPTSFTCPVSGEVIRGFLMDGQPRFVGKDICAALGYKDSTNAIKQHCRGVAIYHPIVDALGRTQEVRIISEPDMYRLICGSKLPSAIQFESWVFEEVLPAIRKSGGYIAEVQNESPEQLMARALKVAEETLARAQARNRELENKVEEARPKVTFANAVADSESTCLVGELAKLLKQNGVNIGQNRLFKWLREHGYLTKRNAPTQRSMEQGLFHVIERAVVRPDGASLTVSTTKVTGKGQLYFINLFLDRKEAAV